jgi:hypothetical protein
VHEISSVRLCLRGQGKYYHAFAAKGTPLSDAAFLTQVLAKDDGSPLPQAVSDAVRISLVKDLLEGVVWCHLQVGGMSPRGSRLPASGFRSFGSWSCCLASLSLPPFRTLLASTLAPCVVAPVSSFYYYCGLCVIGRPPH